MEWKMMAFLNSVSLKKTLGVLCRVYDPKISHFLVLDVLPWAISARN